MITSPEQAQQAAELVQSGVLSPEEEQQVFSQLQLFQQNAADAASVPPPPQEGSVEDATRKVEDINARTNFQLQAGDRLQEAFTGEARNPLGFPELDLSDRSEQGLGLLPFASNDEERADILLNAIPNARLGLDENGQLLANLGDGTPTGFINSPGLSPRDFSEAAGLGGLFFPAARAAQAVGSTTRAGLLAGGFNTAARGLVGGGLVGATEVTRQAALDALGEARGQERSLDVTQTAFVTALGVGSEVVAPLVQSIARTVRNPFLVRGNNLTDRGKERFREIGIDPDLVDGNPEVIELFKQGPGFTGRAAARDATARASVGENTAAAFTGGARSPQAAGEAVRSGLQAEATAASRAVDDRFTEARSFQARFSPEALKFQGRQAGQLVREGGGNVGGRVDKTVRSFETSVLGLNKKGERLVDDLDTSPPATLTRYVAWRSAQKATARELNKKKGSQAKAINDFIDETDQALVDQFEAGFAQGDPQSLEVFKDARELHKTFIERFKENRIVNDIITDQELNPEQTVNLLLGSAEAVPGAKVQSSKALKRVFDIVGRESEAGQAVVDQATQRLFAKHARDGRLDTSAFGKDWVKFRKNNQSIVEQIWSPEQVAILNDIGTRGGATDLVKIAGDILTVRAGVAGSAVAGSVRRLAGVQQPAAAGTRPLLSSGVARAGTAQLGTDENRNLGQ